MHNPFDSRVALAQGHGERSRTMNLYILRHGPARDKVAWAPRPDRLRPLTNDGKRRVKAVAKGMRRQGLTFDVILTSPYERARETAKIVAKILGQKRKLVEFEPLSPDGDSEELMREIARNGKQWEDILLVGHEPSLSQLISTLAAGNTSSFIEMKKAGLAKLAVTQPRLGRCATLEFLVPPKLIS